MGVGLFVASHLSAFTRPRWQRRYVALLGIARSQRLVGRAPRTPSANKSKSEIGLTFFEPTAALSPKDSEISAPRLPSSAKTKSEFRLENRTQTPARAFAFSWSASRASRASHAPHASAPPRPPRPPRLRRRCSHAGCRAKDARCAAPDAPGARARPRIRVGARARAFALALAFALAFAFALSPYLTGTLAAQKPLMQFTSEPGTAQQSAAVVHFSYSMAQPSGLPPHTSLPLSSGRQ